MDGLDLSFSMQFSASSLMQSGTAENRSWKGEHLANLPSRWAFKRRFYRGKTAAITTAYVPFRFVSFRTFRVDEIKAVAAPGISLRFPPTRWAVKQPDKTKPNRLLTNWWLYAVRPEK